eukprot:NODE_647_length_1543_cov_68.178046_g534_i0.p1 GENE.NODE_647_length_1543_cov_68.178046_g534_i0~~NODE_647_length_1543_cov_68.178046_g534_i0.p1  ORF type:complete len:235 (+),score=58.06 NODE_647_length_1543_cov_68.178046_g534_i0:293-997(+)
MPDKEDGQAYVLNTEVMHLELMTREGPHRVGARSEISVTTREAFAGVAIAVLSKGSTRHMESSRLNGVLLRGGSLDLSDSFGDVMPLQGLMLELHPGALRVVPPPNHPYGTVLDKLYEELLRFVGNHDLIMRRVAATGPPGIEVLPRGVGSDVVGFVMSRCELATRTQSVVVVHTQRLALDFDPGNYRVFRVLLEGEGEGEEMALTLGAGKEVSALRCSDKLAEHGSQVLRRVV